MHRDTATSEVAGDFGFHIDMNNSEELAKLLRAKHIRDVEISNELISYANDRYNWSEICARLFELYEDTLDAKK